MYVCIYMYQYLCKLCMYKVSKYSDRLYETNLLLSFTFRLFTSFHFRAELP